LCIDRVGHPIESRRITVPTFVAAAIANHLTAWKSCYRTTSYSAGTARSFSARPDTSPAWSNHPGNPESRYWGGGQPGPTPEEWLMNANRKLGSWSEAWADWAEKRAVQNIAPRKTLASDQHSPLGAAPALYVRDLFPP